MKTISAEQFKKQYGEQAYNQFGVSVPKKTSGFLNEAKARIQESGEQMGAQFRGQGPYAGQSDIRKATGVVATAFSTPVGLAKDVLPEVAERGLEKVGEAAGKGLQWIAEKTTPKFLEDFVTKYPKAAKALEEAAGTVANLGEISSDILVTDQVSMGLQKGVDLTKKAGQKVEQSIEAGFKTGEDLIAKGKEALGPTPQTPRKAMGQVLQGKSRDIKAGVQGLKEVDTTGVKSYKDLASKVDKTIKDLSRRVDDTLDNTMPVKLKDLKLSGKTAAGQKVSVDYVSRSLEQLKELYKSTGDDIALRNAEDLLRKSKIEGLTRLEVNNLARQYGQEFGEKAFSKMGDPLTSVNAVKFENTRKMLKEVARQGLKGKEAEAIDKSISSLYRVKDLVKKNVEAVNKLNQKIQERGLLEKAGYYATKTLDTMTGGTLRGIFGGILPRGVGYKVMNALDIEAALQKNLEIIQKALRANDPELMKFLNKAKEKGVIEGRQ